MTTTVPVSCVIREPEEDAGHDPVVLSSSLGTTHEMWSPQTAALGEHLRLVAYDHRGHGGSPVEPSPYSIDDLGTDVVHLLDRLGIERAAFCGLSLGGMVGIWLAAHAPDRVSRLALCCTSANLGPPSLWQERQAAVREKGTSSIADAVVGRWFTEPFRERRPDVVVALRSMLEATPDEGYVGCCAAIECFDGRSLLDAISCPTVVIAGGDDQATPLWHAELLADRIPNAELLVVPGAAHLASVERPDVVNDVLLAHFTDERALS